MSEIRLFSLSGKVTQLKDNAVALEKELQTFLIKRNQTLFPIFFILRLKNFLSLKGNIKWKKRL